MTQIIPADQRVTATRGVKVLILGPTGVGKTSQLRTLDPQTTLFIDIEAGDLAVQDLAVDTLRPRTWPECRDLAVALAGANPAVPADACYSAAHYAAVRDQFGDPERLGRYRPSSSTASPPPAGCASPGRASSRKPSPIAAARRISAAPTVCTRREMLAWLMHLQQARGINVIFVGVLETVTDDFNRTEHRLQLEGARTGRELPAIVDEVITYNWIDFGDGVLDAQPSSAPRRTRGAIPAKDRSGRLDQLEPPHLGKLINKLTKPGAAASPDLSAAHESKEAQRITMTYDYNTAGEQRSFDVIPDGTIAVCK